MVLFILDRSSATEALAAAVQLGCAVWLGFDVLTDEEYQQRCQGGLEASRFDYSLSDGDSEVLKDALGTIEEHHPGELIWIQHLRH